MKMTGQRKQNMCSPRGGVIPVIISKKWESIICFANMNNRRVYFSSAGKICNKQLRKIDPFIFALISLNNLNKQLSEMSDIKTQYPK
jgi:hypothetical protein